MPALSTWNLDPTRLLTRRELATILADLAAEEQESLLIFGADDGKERLGEGILEAGKSEAANMLLPGCFISKRHLAGQAAWQLRCQIAVHPP